VPQPAPAAVDGTGVPIRLAGTDPINGRPVDLATFRGRPVVLQIWASWCHGCNDEAPHVSTLSKRRSDIAFVGLNFRDVDSEAQGFYRRYGWTFPSIADPQGDLAFGLGLQGTPTTIFLDAEHREIGRIVGATDETEFERAIDYVVGRT
jgi:thiol-disulfide isomerase/thioredoxin